MLVNLHTILLTTSSIFALSASALPYEPDLDLSKAAIQQSSSGEPYVVAPVKPVEGVAVEKEKATTKQNTHAHHAHGLKHTTLHKKHKQAHKSSTASTSAATASVKKADHKKITKKVTKTRKLTSVIATSSSSSSKHITDLAKHRQPSRHTASAIVAHSSSTESSSAFSTYSSSTVLSQHVVPTPSYTAPGVFPPFNATASGTAGARLNGTGSLSNLTAIYVKPTTIANMTSAPFQSAAAGNATYLNGSSIASSQFAYPPASIDFSMPDKIRGVNIGGWLVLEKWMLPDVFTGAFANAVDQWSFDQIPGAKAALHQHWSTYFTEADVENLAGWGINAVRIPIGYWAYENTCKDTPYIKGADKFLQKAVGWCQKHGIKVLIDAHGSPGSQNGFDNSGHSGQAGWQSGDNLKITTDVLLKITKKYGTAKYADTVFAIEMTNEPISWGANKFTTTQSWSQTTYAAIKKAATNPNLAVIMHDGFMGPASWQSVGSTVNGKNKKLAKSQFWIDVHMYQNQDDADKALNQQQHIEKACNYASTEFLPKSSNLPVVVGEWTGATDICAYPDGTTTAGTSCNVDGCQCSANTWVGQWNAPLIAATRKFFEAQMDVYEANTKGWFMWSYDGPGAWGLKNAVQYGLVGARVTDRMYPGQCK